MPDLAAVTRAAHEAERLLRNGSHWQWSTVALLGFALYVYAVEVERRRWDIVLAGLAFWLMDWFNETINSGVLHVRDPAGLWTITGHTGYLILIGLNIAISLLFLGARAAVVEQPPRDPSP